MFLNWQAHVGLHFLVFKNCRGHSQRQLWTKRLVACPRGASNPNATQLFCHKFIKEENALLIASDQINYLGLLILKFVKRNRLDSYYLVFCILLAFMCFCLFFGKFSMISKNTLYIFNTLCKWTRCHLLNVFNKHSIGLSFVFELFYKYY